LKGKDVSNGYILLATACDGTLATTAQFTSIRVVCNNTLAIALRNGSTSAGVVKVPHSTNLMQKRSNSNWVFPFVHGMSICMK
jgi:hypothetical protein